MSWYLYLLECENGSIYTGIAVDVEARFALHRAGKGAKYTRANRPLRILATVRYRDRSLASKAEHAMKQLSAGEKRAFCEARAAKKKRKKKADTKKKMPKVSS